MYRLIISRVDPHTGKMVIYAYEKLLNMVHPVAIARVEEETGGVVLNYYKMDMRGQRSGG